MDFPTGHPALVGRPQRFGFFALFAGLLITGVVKVDLKERAIVGRIDFPAGTSGGESLFVPRKPGAPSAECEDDGFLLTYVSTAESSQLWVMDAKTMSKQAILDLPSRIPWGFHSTFVPAADV
jgi:9-cis-epoxycarotenoid dioxygenase